MHPRFTTPLNGVVDALQQDGVGLHLLGLDGGVFTDEGKFYGSFAGDPKFTGPAARLVAPNATVTDPQTGTVSKPSFDEKAAGYKMIVISEQAHGAGAGRFGLPKGGK
jgi:hypothetical protein